MESGCQEQKTTPPPPSPPLPTFFRGAAGEMQLIYFTSSQTGLSTAEADPAEERSDGSSACAGLGPGSEDSSSGSINDHKKPPHNKTKYDRILTCPDFALQWSAWFRHRLKDMSHFYGLFFKNGCLHYHWWSYSKQGFDSITKKIKERLEVR